MCLLYDWSTRRLTESGFMWFYGEAENRTCDPWFTRHSAYPLHHGGFSNIGLSPIPWHCLWPCSLAVPVLAGWVFAFCGSISELPKAQPAVVLVLKRLRRRGNGLKSHPTDWEKPGIEPATPGLQDIGLSPIPWRLFCGRFPWL